MQIAGLFDNILSPRKRYTSLTIDSNNFVQGALKESPKSFGLK